MSIDRQKPNKLVETLSSISQKFSETKVGEGFMVAWYLFQVLIGKEAEIADELDSAHSVPQKTR